MDSALLVHRLQFAFTITYHYLFPQLTMGLAPLIVVLKTMALRTGNASVYNDAARFWAKIFGINFVIGVVTGIPMEFQFGTNWSHFSRFAGGVIGQTLAMEGVFAFFLESAFLGLFLYGEKRLVPKAHWWSAMAVFVGSWISGYFIVATDAWMQHPRGLHVAGGWFRALTSFWALVLNPWAIWQYAHNMAAPSSRVLSSWLPWGRSICCETSTSSTPAALLLPASSPDSFSRICSSVPRVMDRAQSREASARNTCGHGSTLQDAARGSAGNHRATGCREEDDR